LDTKRLQELVAEDGPFASIYYDASHNTEDAAAQDDLRWRALRDQLADQGADDTVLATVENAVRTAGTPVGRVGRVVVANAEHVLVDEDIEAPPAQPIVRLSPFPYVLPLAVRSGTAVPYLVVVADRVGADIRVFDRSGKPVDTEDVEGDDFPVHKVRGGGLAHRHMQAAVEETQKDNANQVAEAVMKLVQESGAGIVFLAGELQTRTALHDALPERVRTITTVVDGATRARGASNEGLDKAISEVITGRRLAELDDAVTRFRTEAGRDNGLAVEGLGPVTAALREGNVETLLVRDPADAEVFVGAQANQVGVAENETAVTEGEHVARRRADEALPFAAIAVGAGLVAIDERLDLAEGFGALLRHT
jgi:release factor family 2